MDEFQTRPQQVVADVPIHDNSDGGERRKRRWSEFIKHKPAANLHHAIRIAETKGFPLNLFVSIHFRFTECGVDNVWDTFQQLRLRFGKWVSRPSRRSKHKAVPPTFVWVLERPTNNHLHCHWLVHVPQRRQNDFREQLPSWVHRLAGSISDESAALDIKRVRSARAAGKYMLKGMQPGVAVCFDIRASPQGWIEGRRSGFSKNIGPTQKMLLRAEGKYPPAKHYIRNLFGTPQQNA